MDAETIRSHLRAVPFVPFRLHTSQGQHYDIPSPDQMLVTNTRASLLDSRTEEIARVSILQVYAIVPLCDPDAHS